MILTNRFFDTFDNVFDVFHKADFYGSNLANYASDEMTNLELALPGFSRVAFFVYISTIIKT